MTSFVKLFQSLKTLCVKKVLRMCKLHCILNNLRFVCFNSKLNLQLFHEGMNVVYCKDVDDGISVDDLDVMLVDNEVINDCRDYYFGDYDGPPSAIN